MQTAERQVVFISYAREDGKAFAKRLQSELESAGFQTWMDERNIDPYQDFSAEIETAIRAAHFVVVCVTKDVSFRENSFVRREIVYSQLWQQVTGDRPKLIPLVFPDGFPPPITIVHLTHIPCYTGKERTLDFEFGLRELRKRLGVEETLPPHTVGTRHEPSAVLPETAPPTLPEITQPISPAPDPYRDHLGRLYDSIVDYLGQTVFSLITLSSTATPDAVASPNVLPMRFSDANAGHIYGNIAEAFAANGESLLLLGDPGAGKTTTLLAFGREMVARRLENPDLRVPVYLRIPEWSREMQPGLDAWVAEKTALPLDTVTELRRAGRLLLLLDGLDELGDSYEITERGAFGGVRAAAAEKIDPRLRFIETLMRDLGANAVMITCRIKDYAEIGTKIPLKGAVTLRPLDDDQLAEYLRDQPDLLTAVRTDAGLRDMAGTPLLLSLLRFAYAGMSEADRQQLRDLSHSPVELREKIFESYVEHRFEHEQRRVNVPLQYDLETSVRLLGRLAVYLATPSLLPRVETRVFSALAGRYVSEKDAAAALADFNPFLEQMRRMHLLVGEGVNVRFIHLLLRDYFAYSGMKQTSVDDYGYYNAVSAARLLNAARVLPMLHGWLDTLLSRTQLKAYAVTAMLSTLMLMNESASFVRYLDRILTDADGKLRAQEIRERRKVILSNFRIALLLGGFAILPGFIVQNVISALQGNGETIFAAWWVFALSAITMVAAYWRLSQRLLDPIARVKIINDSVTSQAYIIKRHSPVFRDAVTALLHKHANHANPEIRRAVQAALEKLK
ncbi:MAG: TIR domain-containing protein [Anaerolinea sp.]|nr:TIR domain-containing protein [Anaerolinea sp.]